MTVRGGSVWGRRPLVVGHRGGRGPGWPRENTLDAFERARREGAPAVELDVRTCAGGDVVVFHDADVAEGRRVRDVPLRELRALGVPTLAEVLSWARATGTGVNVEMKHDVPDRLALARGAMHAVAASGADVLVSSFDPLLLAMGAAFGPAVPRALLVHAGQPLWATALQRALRPSLAEALHLEVPQATPRAVARHLRLGLRLGVWTPNDPAEARRLVALGVASIITDAPGAVVEALSARAAPHSQTTSSARTPGGAG